MKMVLLSRKILYLIMAVWLAVISSAGATTFVCHSSNCPFGGKTQVNDGTGYDCTASADTTGVEARAFFADDYASYDGNFASIGSNAKKELSSDCLSELGQGVENLTPAKSISQFNPINSKKAVADFVFPAPTGTVFAYLENHQGPKSQSPIYHSVSSLRC